MKVFKEILALIVPNTRGQTFQWAVFIGAIAFATALFAPPALDKAAKNYAESRGLGIDQVVTGSVEQRAKRYTIRKSVLDDQQ
ncbi:MAG: hypothetical protein AAF412_08545 [Pseudomonadota bacterium]